MDAAGRVRAAMATHPRERFLPASERAAGGLRRPARHRPRPDQQPAAHGARRCSSCSTCSRASGCSTSGRGRAGPPPCSPSWSGRPARCSGSSGCPTSCVTGAANVEAARMPWARVRAVRRRGARGARRGAVRPGPGVGHGDPAPGGAGRPAGRDRHPRGAGGRPDAAGRSATPAPRTGGGSPSTATTASSRWSPTDRRGPETARRRPPRELPRRIRHDHSESCAVTGAVPGRVAASSAGPRTG